MAQLAVCIVHFLFLSVYDAVGEIWVFYDTQGGRQDSCVPLVHFDHFCTDFTVVVPS